MTRLISLLCASFLALALYLPSAQAAAQIGPLVYSNSFPTSASIASFYKYYSVGNPVYGGLEWGIYANNGMHSNDGYVVPYVQTNRTDWDATRVINDFGVFFDQTNATMLTDAFVFCNVQCRSWAGHFEGVGARMDTNQNYYAAVFGATAVDTWRVRLLKRVAGVTTVLAEQNPGAFWRGGTIALNCNATVRN